MIYLEEDELPDDFEEEVVDELDEYELVLWDGSSINLAVAVAADFA